MSPLVPADPAARGGVAILGCGTIARSAHLPAYRQHGIGVVGAWSRSGSAAEARREFPEIGRVYADPEELLADPAVRFVDLATPPEGRLAWIERAVAAGKHVLAQKPLLATAEELAVLPGVLRAAEDAGVLVAVNHNGRWAPPWRRATEAIRAGDVGEVVGVTHLHDKELPPLVGTPFDAIEHMLLTDYLLHWLDITRTWLQPARVRLVQAVDARVPGQPAEARNPWGAVVTLVTDAGSTATVRIAGNAVASAPGCPFWVHGTTGSLRGSVLLGSDRLALDRGSGDVRDLPLEGAWFTDGFAAAMGELMLAAAQGRQPEHSAADAARSVRLMLAARDSAAAGGVPVTLAEGEG